MFSIFCNRNTNISYFWKVFDFFLKKFNPQYLNQLVSSFCTNINQVWFSNASYSAKFSFFPLWLRTFCSCKIYSFNFCFRFISQCFFFLQKKNKIPLFSRPIVCGFKNLFLKFTLLKSLPLVRRSAKFFAIFKQHWFAGSLIGGSYNVGNIVLLLYFLFNRIIKKVARRNVSGFFFLAKKLLDSRYCNDCFLFYSWHCFWNYCCIVSFRNCCYWRL